MYAIEISYSGNRITHTDSDSSHNSSTAVGSQDLRAQDRRHRESCTCTVCIDQNNVCLCCRLWSARTLLRSSHGYEFLWSELPRENSTRFSAFPRDEERNQRTTGRRANKRFQSSTTESVKFKREISKQSPPTQLRVWLLDVRRRRYRVSDSLWYG